MQLSDKFRKEVRRQKFGKGLCIFFVLMFICTFVSRAAYSVTVAKVIAENLYGGKLSFSVSGMGTIDAREISLVYIPGGYVVESCVSQGQAVQPQDVILTFLKKDLEKKKMQLDQEVQKLELQLEQAKLSVLPDAVVPAADSAARSLEQLRQAQAEQNAAYAQVQQEYQNLEQEYQQKQKKLEKEKEQQKDAAVYEQKSKEFTAWYEEQRAGIDAKVTAVTEQQKQVNQALTDAQNMLEDAKKNDAATEQNQQKQQKAAEYTVEGIRIDLEAKQQEQKELQELLDAEGKISADQAGTVLSNPLTAGSMSSGSDFIPIGTGGLILQAELEEEQAARVAVGDVLTIQGEEDGKTAQAVVEKILKSQEQESEKWILTAVFKEKDDRFRAGQQTSFMLEKTSKEEYEYKIPLSAVYQDANGYYCLCAERKKTILGEEYQAKKVSLTIEDQDETYAAITTAISKQDQIITGGNKNVEPGDRVRIIQEEQAE